MKILAIAAHPDDIEIMCAGSLALYAIGGHTIYFAVFTNGDMGDMKIRPGKLAQIRKRETERAAAYIGARVLWGGITDELVFPDAAQRMVMIDLLRSADPDVIITHNPNDYHPDHRYVSQLVFDSYFQKGLPHIPGQKLAACRFGVAPIYYMDTLGGVNFQPTEYVDITSVMKTKRKMLECHKSQVVTLKNLAHTDMLGMMDTQARFRGITAGCAHAEGFRKLEAFQRGLTRRVLP